MINIRQTCQTRRSAECGRQSKPCQFLDFSGIQIAVPQCWLIVVRNTTHQWSDAVDKDCKNCLLHCALSLAAQCIVIGPVCNGLAGGRRCVFVAVWVCYHDNSKLHASTFTKLGM